MQAKCPNCETIFRLTEDQLSAANGKVRCGLCHVIFTAQSIDEESMEKNQQGIDEESMGQNQQTIDEQSMERNKQGIDEESFEKNQQPINEHIEDDAFSSPDLISPLADSEQDDSHDLFTDDDETSDVIPNEYRALAESGSDSQLSTIAWSFGIIFLVFTLITEYAWFNRNKLSQNPNINPWISQFCKITGCTVAPIHAPDLLEMVNRNIYTHPNIKNALMVTATMVNQAPYAQAYPAIEIGFSNIRGKLVVQRVFSPEEYMKQETKNLRLMLPNKPVSFGIEIKDPGKLAMTYEFKFL